MNKFNIGDKVKVIKYGSLMWISKKATIEMEAFKDYLAYSEDDKTKVIDMYPDLIGKEGIVDSFHESQGSYQYSIYGPWKHAWYNESQLELI